VPSRRPTFRGVTCRLGFLVFAKEFVISMSVQRLRLLQVFGSVLGVASLPACGLRGDFAERLCEEGGEVPLVQGLNPSEPVDYVALRTDPRGDDVAPWVIQESGACEGSFACGKLQDPVDGQGMRWAWAGGTEHVAHSRGDEVELLWNVGDVREFLGTVDTATEAALLVYLSGYDLDCAGPNLDRDGGDYTLYAERGHTCGSDVKGYRIRVAADGSLTELESEVVEEGDDGCVIGRLPPGLANSATRGGGDVGDFFARASFLEAASVVAFEHLAAELQHHGAPDSLVRSARLAAREEVSHALMTGLLAARAGAHTGTPRVVRGPTRGLEAIALDNAVEGLGRETFGALLGHHQALHAEDPVVRDVMRAIAVDETRHAELSQALHAWLSPQLSLAANRRVSDARRDALKRFRQTLCAERPPGVRRAVGLPTAARATQMFDQLFHELDARETATTLVS
jgi:hypothetical protein